MLTETPSKPKQYLRLLGKYLWARGLMTAVGGYMVFSVLLLAATGIDICIPCLWTAIFGVHCPGCGLTTACISIVKLDFVGAWESNPLAYLLLPAGTFFLLQDAFRFLKQQQAATPAEIATDAN